MSKSNQPAQDKAEKTMREKYQKYLLLSAFCEEKTQMSFEEWVLDYADTMKDEGKVL